MTGQQAKVEGFAGGGLSPEWDYRQHHTTTTGGFRDTHKKLEKRDHHPLSLPGGKVNILCKADLTNVKSKAWESHRSKSRLDGS